MEGSENRILPLPKRAGPFVQGHRGHHSTCDPKGSNTFKTTWISPPTGPSVKSPEIRTVSKGFCSSGRLWLLQSCHRGTEAAPNGSKAALRQSGGNGVRLPKAAPKKHGCLKSL